jgi:hypothetical protein
MIKSFRKIYTPAETGSQHLETMSDGLLLGFIKYHCSTRLLICATTHSHYIIAYRCTNLPAHITHLLMCTSTHILTFPYMCTNPAVHSTHLLICAPTQLLTYYVYIFACIHNNSPSHRSIITYITVAGLLIID